MTSNNILFVIIMNEKKIINYNEFSIDENELTDSLIKMKLLYDHATFNLHKFQVEELIKDYEQLKNLREDIQVKYFSIYEKLSEEGLIEGDLDKINWGLNREKENEVWNSELKLISDMKTDFDMAISMIESGEAEAIINK